MLHSDRQTATVGDIVSAFLYHHGVSTAFGVISVDNLPMLDALGRDEQTRFIPCRGEAGAVNMADAYARVSGRLGVAFTSTGISAANAIGSLLEAQSACTPLLHLTSQPDTSYLYRSSDYLHQTHAQSAMLQTVCKATFRVQSANTALATFKQAARIALTAPMGPVSVEIPIDIQYSETTWPDDFTPLSLPVAHPNEATLDQIAERLFRCHRPMLWLGGGARSAAMQVLRLVEMGFGIVTSVQGRGILPESDPRSLGAFHSQDSVERFYEDCDAMIVVGSRLRSNETLQHTLQLPRPLFQIDIDPLAHNRSYQVDGFICGDSTLALAGLVERLRGRLKIGRQFHNDLAVARTVAEKLLRADLGPYADFVEALQNTAGQRFIWVRDTTISNSSWGNRLFRIYDARAGVHAVAGGIGQGLPMAIGAAMVTPERKVLALTGDGGLALNLGELATAVQEQANIILIVMNDRSYGAIKNIQDIHYGGRRYYTDIQPPNFAQLAAAVNMRYLQLDKTDQAHPILQQAFSESGPVLLEVDMNSIGSFAKTFIDPPIRK